MREDDECHSFVEHLIAEHRRIHRMLRLAHHTITGAHGSEQDAPPAVVVRVLQQVREELEHHFSQEESGGCLHEAVSRCPPLSAEAQRIEAEHPDLLLGIDRLIAQALDADQSLEKRIAIEVAFDDVCRQLDAHEAAENALLRKGFSIHVESTDSNSVTDDGGKRIVTSDA